MNEFSHLVLITIAALFPITNPLGNAAIFLSITDGQTDTQRRLQAWRAAIYMFLILEVFFLGGAWIMSFFGLSLPGIKIAGGLIITKFGFNLLNPQTGHTHTPEEHREARDSKDVSFSPLAMPLLAGPGAIAAVMGVTAQISSGSMLSYLAVTLGIGSSVLICWIVLREAPWLMKFLGVNGANALTKIMGFLLLCIGVQFLINGIVGVVGPLS
ncbi:MAG: MarC family NAAT transporter [Verrucomicrobiota bacterium]